MTSECKSRSGIDEVLVRRLVDSQFPQWRYLTIRPVERQGHDNRTFRLGNEMSVRLPTRQEYAAHVLIEHEWVPRIGRSLQLPIPVPMGKGSPGEGYPWPWSVNRWLKGEEARIDRISDLTWFASDLANFLNGLHGIDATRGPLPGKHNFFRGGELAAYNEEFRECLGELGVEIPVEEVISVWESALDSKFQGPGVWVHGDVSAENLLVEGGRLCAAIDFGQIAVGDPACDVTMAWTFFSGRGREAFMSDLKVDEATWIRGRGWCLWKALVDFRKYRRERPEEAARSRVVIREILEDS